MGNLNCLRRGLLQTREVLKCRSVAYVTTVGISIS
jgi:hypothetical protein